MDDIPEARRESVALLPEGKPRSPFPGYGLLALGTGAIALGMIGAAIARPDPQAVPWTTQLAEVAMVIGTPPDTLEDRPTLLGHRAYGEVPIAQLVPVPSAPLVQLQPAAAAAVEAMVTAAQAEGVNLLPLSGFRSHADQQYLFFQIKAELGESAIARAEVSAPPGYSEHHTGYAVDFGDGNRPSTHVQISFEDTPAFQWLQQNAPRYNFELSFPKTRTNGVGYEPWHWRFVGDPDSLETFYQAR
ncbi:MAG: D-alanyl-D-alanine carboxypeptidase family protein [Leptolyngbya sp. RL_3_1]|nr:D-alanyl-D-alanine carboxypeptidase family protein [Leptolyngbya sp. RL_3_1]